MEQVLVGVDYGRKRIGVAVSTPLGTVHPRPRIERTEPAADLAALEALAAGVGAVAFVVGLPHHMDGNLSEMEEEARAFARELAERTGRPVYGSDERLTTEEAESILRARDVPPRERRNLRDSTAACILLHDFLQAPPDARERIA